MIRLSLQALNQLRDLLHHDEALDRLGAFENLLKSIEQACTRIEANPESGLPGPRPYNQRAKLGLRRLKSGPTG